MFETFKDLVKIVKIKYYRYSRSLVFNKQINYYKTFTISRIFHDECYKNKLNNWLLIKNFDSRMFELNYFQRYFRYYLAVVRLV